MSDTYEYQNRLLQTNEDSRVQIEIIRESQRLFDEWKDHKLPFFVPIVKPQCYTVHNEKTAKFFKTGISNLILDRFERLKQNYQVNEMQSL